MISIDPNDAEKIRGWIRSRGGVAIWRSLDLGAPGETFTPALAEDGAPMGPPGWQYEKAPTAVLTSEEAVTVQTKRHVKDVPIGIERGCGLTLVLTSASRRRLKDALERIEEAAWYEFGFNDKDRRVAHIFVAAETVPLSSFGKETLT